MSEDQVSDLINAIDSELTKVESLIYLFESEYLSESNEIGNALKGYHFNRLFRFSTTSQRVTNLKKQKVEENDRLFSLSSKTSEAFKRVAENSRLENRKKLKKIEPKDPPSDNSEESSKDPSFEDDVEDKKRVRRSKFITRRKNRTSFSPRRKRVFPKRKEEESFSKKSKKSKDIKRASASIEKDRLMGDMLISDFKEKKVDPKLLSMKTSPIVSQKGIADVKTKEEANRHFLTSIKISSMTKEQLIDGDEEVSKRRRSFYMIRNKMLERTLSNDKMMTRRDRTSPTFTRNSKDFSKSLKKFDEVKGGVVSFVSFGDRRERKIDDIQFRDHKK